MVSGLGFHVQLLSTELALKAIQIQQEASANDAGPVLLIETPADTAPIADIELHEPQEALPEGLPPASPAGAIAETASDITTPDFMTTLKGQLEELSQNPDSARQGEAMLQALKAGTLKVFDPIGGISITARDADTDIANERAITITAAGWSQFIKQRVKRGDDSAYVKDSSGNYIDAVSGECAYFEIVGNKYYYFTWP